MRTYHIDEDDCKTYDPELHLATGMGTGYTPISNMLLRALVLIVLFSFIGTCTLAFLQTSGIEQVQRPESITPPDEFASDGEAKLLFIILVLAIAVSVLFSVIGGTKVCTMAQRTGKAPRE